MTIQLSSELEATVYSEAQRLGTTPDSLVESVLRERFAELPKPGDPMTPEQAQEWKRRLRSISQPCGVVLSDEALSRESLYD